MVTKLNPRYLAERSYLYFKYPQPSDGFDRSIDFYLPMLENIEISESQKPNLATYDLIGRSGSLYSYLGSKSREFTLKFNITLPNVLEYMQNTLGTTGGLDLRFISGFRYFYSSKNSLIRYMLDQGDTAANALLDSYEEAKKINPTFKNEPQDKGSLVNFFTGFTNTLTSISDWFNPKQQQSNTQDAVNYVINWINVIRTSTVNNSKDTNLSPPSIYINHGTMYNNIPCVCTGYSIRLVNNIGYDLVSLTPRQIEVNMSLSENRVGNFGLFEPFQSIESENRYGWESIMNHGTGDPYNSTFDYLEEDLALQADIGA